MNDARLTGARVDHRAVQDERQRRGEESHERAEFVGGAARPAAVAALLTRMSTLRPGLDVNRSAVAATASAVRAQMATRTPSAANERAIARPIPRLPPVTSAVLPASCRSMPEPFHSSSKVTLDVPSASAPLGSTHVVTSHFGRSLTTTEPTTSAIPVPHPGVWSAQWRLPTS